jgi:hypothetical protein
MFEGKELRAVTLAAIAAPLLNFCAPAKPEQRFTPLEDNIVSPSPISKKFHHRQLVAYSADDNLLWLEMDENHNPLDICIDTLRRNSYRDVFTGKRMLLAAPMVPLSQELFQNREICSFPETTMAYSLVETSLNDPELIAIEFRDEPNLPTT